MNGLETAKVLLKSDLLTILRVNRNTIIPKKLHSGLFSPRQMIRSCNRSILSILRRSEGHGEKLAISRVWKPMPLQIRSEQYIELAQIFDKSTYVINCCVLWCRPCLIWISVWLHYFKELLEVYAWWMPWSLGHFGNFQISDLIDCQCILQQIQLFYTMLSSDSRELRLNHMIHCIDPIWSTFSCETCWPQIYFRNPQIWLVLEIFSWEEMFGFLLSMSPDPSRFVGVRCAVTCIWCYML